MPTLFSIFGLRFIHIRKGKAKAKFVLEPKIALVDSKGFKDQELSLAKSLIEENKNLIIVNAEKLYSIDKLEFRVFQPTANRLNSHKNTVCHCRLVSANQLLTS